MSETVTVQRADLDILVAACTSYFPPDVSPEVNEAFARLLAAIAILAAFTAAALAVGATLIPIPA